MQIKIAERLRPFSHVPGTYCMLPGSALRFQIFPALIRVHGLQRTEPTLKEEIILPIEGPVKEFTVQLDLENGCIRVWGNSPTGFFRYRIHSLNNLPGWELFVEKSPDEKLQAVIPLVEKSFYKPVEEKERLSLGCHKEQDWAMICRRQQLSEILPFWFRLGQMFYLESKTTTLQGTASLLEKCKEQIKIVDSSMRLEPFHHLFITGFEGILSPRLLDQEYHGLKLPELMTRDLSPLVLLIEGSRVIRNLFIQQEGNKIEILPYLPSQFHCGRMTDLVCGNERIDLEWSKKQIRRMILRSVLSGEVRVSFPKGVHTFRLRSGTNDLGIRVPCNTPISIESGISYYLDNFER